MYGWVGGWVGVDGWMDGWMEYKMDLPVKALNANIYVCMAHS